MPKLLPIGQAKIKLTEETVEAKRRRSKESKKKMLEAARKAFKKDPSKENKQRLMLLEKDTYTPPKGLPGSKSSK